MSRHFELLNYSEHGTTVDNVLYSCDFSDKPATTPQPSSMVAAVRDIINKGGGSSATTNKSGTRSRSTKLKPEVEDDDEETEDCKDLHDLTTPRMSARAHDVRAALAVFFCCC